MVKYLKTSNANWHIRVMDDWVSFLDFIEILDITELDNYYLLEEFKKTRFIKDDGQMFFMYKHLSEVCKFINGIIPEFKNVEPEIKRVLKADFERVLTKQDLEWALNTTQRALDIIKKDYSYLERTTKGLQDGLDLISIQLKSGEYNNEALKRKFRAIHCPKFIKDKKITGIRHLFG